MDLTNKKKSLVDEFIPSLLSFRMSTKIWIGLLVMFILFAFYGFFVQIVDGHEATGMRDNVVWGVFIVNFIFFVTLSYSGMIIGGVLHFYNSPWKNAVARMINIITVLSIIVGPIFILLCIGRLDRLHYLFIYPKFQSPITKDIVVIVTYMFGCFLYLYVTLIKDFALLRDNCGENTPKWRKNLYRYLAIGFKDTEEQRVLLKRTTNILVIVQLMLAFVAYTVITWIFSLNIQPGWNSTIFAPYFIIAGLYSAIGVIILCMYIFRRVLHLEKYIRIMHFKAAGVILLVFALFYGYFTFSEYFPRWFSDKPADDRLMETLWNRYFWAFIVANYVGVFVPILVMLFKRLRTIKMITFAGIIAIVSLWLNRYLIVIPTLETPFLPVQDTRPEYLHYSATWIEWALTFGGIAAFLLMFFLIIKFVPVIPMSGIIDHERELKKKKDLNPSINEEI